MDYVIPSIRQTQTGTVHDYALVFRILALVPLWVRGIDSFFPTIIGERFLMLISLLVGFTLRRVL
jgi:hypothetical protein